MCDAADQIKEVVAKNKSSLWESLPRQIMTLINDAKKQAASKKRA